jgi:hypothetical protein
MAQCQYQHHIAVAEAVACHAAWLRDAIVLALGRARQHFNSWAAARLHHQYASVRSASGNDTDHGHALISAEENVMSNPKSNSTSFKPGREKTGGRRKGALNKATLKSGATIAEMARTTVPEAFDKLIELMREGETQMVQLHAANAILDRGLGRAPLVMQGTLVGNVVLRTPEQVYAELQRRGITPEMMSALPRMLEKANVIDNEPREPAAAANGGGAAQRANGD